MNVKAVLFYTCVLFAWVSCSSKEQYGKKDFSVIDVDGILNDNYEFDMEEMTDSLKIIRLDNSNSNSVVGNILYTMIVDDRIYIIDDYLQCSVVIFDTAGNYITRLKQGNAPGEITSRISNIAYDYERDELLLSNYFTIVYYTKDGEYIRTKRLPDELGYFDTFQKIRNGYAFMRRTNTYATSFKDYLFYTTDEQFNVKTKALKFDANISRGVRFISMLHSDGGLSLAVPFHNNIYEYKNDSVKLKYVLSFNDKRIDMKGVNNNNFDINVEKNSNKYYFQGGYYETSTHQMLMLEGEEKNNRIYRDKLSGNSISASSDLIKNDIYPIIFNVVGCNDDYFIYEWYIGNVRPIVNDRLLTPDTYDMLQKLTVDDNSLLVLVKFKHF